MKIEDRLRKLPPMDFWQKRAQKIDWAVGQLLCMRNGAALDEWALRLTAAKLLEKS